MRAGVRVITGIAVRGVELGPLTVAATGRGVVVIEWAGVRTERALRGIDANTEPDAAAGEVLDAAERELRAYAAGEVVRFDTPIDWDGLGGLGTPFENEVWRGLTEIPPGETRSYAEIARAIRRPGAERAVGRANGRNRVSLMIPCHRVIGADGTLTGYGGGLNRKRALLEHEGAIEPAAGLFSGLGP